MSFFASNSLELHKWQAPTLKLTPLISKEKCSSDHMDYLQDNSNYDYDGYHNE